MEILVPAPLEAHYLEDPIDRSQPLVFQVPDVLSKAECEGLMEIGAQLMNARASFHSQRAAYHAYQAAIGNAEAAERLCVYKEMDFYGYSAVDRHQLSGVSCPNGHQGPEVKWTCFESHFCEAAERAARA